MKTIFENTDPRQCPLCGGADQHEKTCALEGKKHVYKREWPEPEVDWDATLRENNGAEAIWSIND